MYCVYMLCVICLYIILCLCISEWLEREMTAFALTTTIQEIVGGTIISTELRSKLHEANNILSTQNPEARAVFVREMTTATATMPATIPKTEMITMQEQDDDISQVLPDLKSNRKPTRRQTMTLSKPARKIILVSKRSFLSVTEY